MTVQHTAVAGAYAEPATVFDTPSDFPSSR